ncbi:MAG: threonine dehydratase [Pseudomonadales bacterium]|jgi:threonine dehydratase
MLLPTLRQIEQAASEVYKVLQATPQITWPLLNERCGCDVWVKHENHNPTGSFKVRGGLIYIGNLSKQQPEVQGICAATRGNHGQSIAFAARRFGLNAVIVVPEGNSPDKNAAMRALGAELIVAGNDFDEAVENAQSIAADRGLHLLPSFHIDLVKGVATYALELFRHVPDLDKVYVPIGLGSGIAGMISTRNAMDLDTQIIGVVSENANGYHLSLNAGRCIGTNSANTIADGLAIRNPNREALDVMMGEVDHIVEVSDDEVLGAIAAYFTDTHNVVEGAGAAGLAALLKEKERSEDLKTGIICSGGNITKELFRHALDYPG